MTLNSAQTFLFVGFLSLLGFCSSARATTVIPPDFSTMVHRADVIFRGRVTNIRSEWTGEGAQRCIVSYITFDLLKTLKGKPSSPYVLKMLGGTVGDQTMEVTDAPKFKVGDQTLLFVEHNGTQFVPLVGIMHGYFRVETDPKSGKEFVLKYNGAGLQSTSEIDRDHAQGVVSGGVEKTQAQTPGAPMERADFEKEIQQKVASGP